MLKHKNFPNFIDFSGNMLYNNSVGKWHIFKGGCKMKKTSVERICPKCRKTYTGYPALSRYDNKTEICSACGTKEALEAMGMSTEKQNEILRTIYK